MKKIAIIAAGMLASSVMSVQAGILDAIDWTPGKHVRVCFPDNRLPDERPQDCILTAHPLSSDTHAGGPRDKAPDIKWSKPDKPHVDHHKPETKPPVEDPPLPPADDNSNEEGDE